MTGPVRPTGVLQPARAKPAPAPMQPQVDAQTLQALLALLAMMTQGQQQQSPAPPPGGMPW